MTIFKRDDSGTIPQTWGKMKNFGRHSDNYTVIICCPSCGSLCWLPHEIVRDGTAKGSFQCPHCKFHENEIKLEGF